MCVWRISAASTDDVIKVEVENSKLEKQFGAYGCAFDYVAVYDGLGTFHKKLGQWCGDSKPSFVSSGSTITVVFHSDRSYGTSGFEISYVSGPAENFREDARSSRGITTMGMIGYLVLVLAILCGSMLAIRVVLNKIRWCKCMERPRQRASSIFIRRQRRTASHQTRRSSTARDIFVLPVYPPSYEECRRDLDGSPPPYSAIELTPVTPIPETSPQVVHDNPAFDLDRGLELSPPPPYEETSADIQGYVQSAANGNAHLSNNDIVESSNNASVRSFNQDNIQSSNNDNVQRSNNGNVESSSNVATTTNSSSDTGTPAHGDTDVV
ncbi:uncharacterized protein LOC135472620 isoform X2 [Liolophura sinensis]